MKKMIFYIFMFVASSLMFSSCSKDAEEEKQSDSENKVPSSVKAVDLGLPSGTLWASMNVGATQPEEFGNYYAWGETRAFGEADASNAHNYIYNSKSGYDKMYFGWSTYKWGNDDYGNTFSRYVTNDAYGTADNLTTLELADDAAYVNWGENWRMPTKVEQDELRKKCYWEWTESYKESNIAGFVVYKQKSEADTGRTHGSSYSYSLSDTHIFLPAAGYRDNGSLFNTGSYGYYWASSLEENKPYSAYYLYFSSNLVIWHSYRRCIGHSVRAVRRQ